MDVSFSVWRESRERQMEAIEGVLRRLFYEKGISPDQIVVMKPQELAALALDMKPTENWTDSRFIGMLKHVAGGQV